MRRVWPLLFPALLAAPALAHDTVSAGPVRVEFHTDTNEKLQVNADTRLGFSLSVAGKPVRPAECRCTLLLYPGTPSARVAPLKLALRPDPAAPAQFQATVTVTRAGPYSLVLDGRPARPGAFDPFRLVWPLTAATDVYNKP